MLALPLALVLMLAFGTSSALAVDAANYAYSSSFSAGGSEPGQLSNPQRIAVDSDSGNVFIVDQGNDRAEIFAPTASGDSATYLTEFGSGTLDEPLGIAIDQAANAVYVSDAGADNQIRKWTFDSAATPNFTPDATFISPAQGSGANQIGDFHATLAVAPNGDLLVADPGNNLVKRYDSSGTFVSSFDGSDSPAGAFAGLFDIATAPSGEIFVIDAEGGDPAAGAPSRVESFHPDGSHDARIGPDIPNPRIVTFDAKTGQTLIAGNSNSFASGRLYVFNGTDPVYDAYLGDQVIFGTTVTGLAMDGGSTTSNLYVAAADGHAHAFKAQTVASASIDSIDVSDWTVTLNGTLDPHGHSTSYHLEYSTDGTNWSAGPSSDAGSGNGPVAIHATATELAAKTTYHLRLVAANEVGTVNFGAPDATTTEAVANITTGPATNIQAESATLNGSYSGEGLDTHYYFEYGTDTTYGHLSPALPGADAGSGTGTQNVSADIAELQAGAIYHYRIVASNTSGSSRGQDQTFTAAKPPSVESVSTANVTATSADLEAQLNPNEADTTYHFEYGPTTAYGSSAPVPEGEIASGNTAQSVIVHLSGLHGTVYHFRLIAESKYGTTITADQTFTFFPPNCPNAVVRQQTHAAYLPDCRAYELVSPADAGGTALMQGGPNTGYATSPSRISFTGNAGSIPGAGEANSSAGDLYVATRTGTGWTTKYIGPPASKVACAGGPPSTTYTEPRKLQNGVLTDLSMERFLDWNDGNVLYGCANDGSIFEDFNTAADEQVSNSPYVWDASGSSLGRWPTNLANYPGGAEAFRCHGIPQVQTPQFGCTTAIKASGDLNHFVFSTASGAFGENGLTAAPGSAYDNDTAHNTLSLISKTPTGGDIAQDPGSLDPKEVIQFPGVSTDGSHILMSISTGPHCGPPSCGPPIHAVRLFMRVNNAVTYDVTDGHIVDYVDMTPDGTKVYFTSVQKVTADDHDTSADLFMWSEESKTITRLSAGSAGIGDSDSCSASWTTECGVVTYDDSSYSTQEGGLGGLGVGGIAHGHWTAAQGGLTDNAIAAQSGDIVFYSPEQLDGAKGVNGQVNLYEYHDGHPRYVATLTGGLVCDHQVNGVCSNGPLARLQVSPDGRHAAFITTSQITSYDSAGWAMMYTYDATTGKLTCASCLPNGRPPTDDVHGSQGGLFMTNDGRAFFSTLDAVVPQDTNEAIDVYEFVDGRPQLITAGTGTDSYARSLYGAFAPPGLYGVSANGVDVYFSTLNTLVGQDLNGSQLKFYDARTNGGFPFDPPVAPCAAADECHGPGNSAPSGLVNGTGAALGANGNAISEKRKHKRKRHRHRAHRNGRAARNIEVGKRPDHPGRGSGR